MGQEARCRVRFGGQAGEGKALLETSEIIFVGAFRLVIPFLEISSLAVEGGELSVTFAQGTAVFELGAPAAKWAAKIRNPRGRPEKLGVRPAMIVSVVGVDDPDFLDELKARTPAVSVGGVAEGSDLVFYAADHVEELVRLAELGSQIQPKGAVWVVSRKGKAATLKDVQVMAAARTAGLVDTKVVAFSDTHTALKLVVPAAKRAAGSAKP